MQQHLQMQLQRSNYFYFSCDVAFALLLMRFRFENLEKGRFENWFSLLFIVYTCAKFRSSSSKPLWLCINNFFSCVNAIGLTARERNLIVKPIRKRSLGLCLAFFRTNTLLEKNKCSLWGAVWKKIIHFATPAFLAYLEDFLSNIIYCKFTIYILEI